MKIGIVASAGGAVIFEIYPYLLDCGINIVIVTDRACGIVPAIWSSTFTEASLTR